ncbi:hypothetical protein PHYSODRAFT_307633 [Phytophthora sojae]|uniref:Crinkler effector protein N-terminal domain-containing protein n=1 Tax=Phytophthora sojae (strain P6497) TaxID=1094619 RepID=G5AFH2_PHYSP|nr:hypothetical protein PHYSODRAFT_307633 [Phytophthora sojae]EGZ05962.1 hypothetical protein PHYSODRAFT_307633 [Phytophthora sojae]|eukprot:XP_009538823.1 hypothetical protein PHYSODRAFT_307633 [Phytophthora sojae]
MYLIVGFPGATRMVNVDPDAKISVLTEMLQQDERLQNNEQITLFLAKRNNSWLEYDSKDEAMLALGDVTTNVKGMLTTKAINRDASVDQVFGALPAQRCVHVLVVVPGHKLRGALAGLLGEYKVQMHWNWIMPLHA